MGHRYALLFCVLFTDGSLVTDINQQKYDSAPFHFPHFDLSCHWFDLMH
jgi:hypothetical protein